MNFINRVSFSVLGSQGWFLEWESNQKSFITLCSFIDLERDRQRQTDRENIKKL